MLWFWGLTAAERRAYIPPVGRGPERTREAPKGVGPICGEAIVSAAQGSGGRHIARNTRSYRHRCSKRRLGVPDAAQIATIRTFDRIEEPQRHAADGVVRPGRCEASRNALEERPRGGARDESRTLRSCRRPGPRHITTAPRRSTQPAPHTRSRHQKSQNLTDERTNRQSPKRCRNESSRRERDPSKRVPSVRRPAHDPNPRHG